MLIAAPLLRGGNRQAALAALLGLGLAILAIALAHALAAMRSTRAQVPGRWRFWAFWACLGFLVSAPLWLAVLQLTPLAAPTWTALPGRAAYGPGVQSIAAQLPTTWPLSLHPMATRASLWAGVPVVAALLVGVLVRGRVVPWLFGTVLLAVGCQLVIALAQYVQGPGSMWYFDTDFPGPFIGTFNNRNHLANLIAMGIPAWFAVLAHWRADEPGGNRRVRGHTLTLWYLLGFAMLVVLLATQSRGGLLAAAVALFLSLLIYLKGPERAVGWPAWLGLMALLSAFVAAGVAAVGQDRVTERFASATLRSDADMRNQFALSALEAAKVFWPWGSGAGTFESVFPRFQHVESPGFVSYAHNDYAQWLMEFGAPGLVVALLLLGLVIVQAVRLLGQRWRHGQWRDLELQQCFAGVAVLALALHCWVEFNLHIPALAITGAMLLGLFLRPQVRPQR